jgi:SAM-dependent methyltransferase
VVEEGDSYGNITARYYDAAYGSVPTLGPDVEFYRALAREAGGPVLELGCGTGRALLAIAADGIPCTGVDQSPAMLNALRAKRPPPTLRLARSRMQDFDLGSDRFALVFSAFRAFQHLYTVEDQLACLARVRRHLAPGGLFAFDLFNPRLDRTAQTHEPERESLRFRLDGDEVTRFETVTRDQMAQLLTVRMRYERKRDGAVVANDTVEFQMRWFYRYEVEHLLVRAGFEIVSLFGGFDRSPFGPGSQAILPVARVAS